MEELSQSGQNLARNGTSSILSLWKILKFQYITTLILWHGNCYCLNWLLLVNIYVDKTLKNQITIWILSGVKMVESLGKFLKKERETRNISLEQISNFTKIKEHHLKAIEEDRYELLPPPPYVKGYLNVYAKYLTLDPKNIVLRYEEYLRSLIPPASVESQHQALPKKKSARPWYSLSFFFS